MASEMFDLVIVGGGPAGLTAAVYASRMRMKTLLFESSLLGGRATYAPMVENFPGFPRGISGAELSQRMVEQSEKFGAQIRFPEEVIDLSLDDVKKSVITRTDTIQGLSVIIATGTQRKKLLVPGEAALLGRGVSYCAVCDGPFFKNKVVAVVGSGDYALEDALYLSTLSEKVYLLSQRNDFEATKALVDSCRERKNIEVRKAKVVSILGEDYVKSIMVLDFESERQEDVPVDGVFVVVGEVPMTALVRKAGVAVDEGGCIKVSRKQVTNMEGVFAAGDCTCGGMQIVTAAGEGAAAAIEAYRYVRSIKK